MRPKKQAMEILEQFKIQDGVLHTANLEVSVKLKWTEFRNMENGMYEIMGDRLIKTNQDPAEFPELSEPKGKKIEMGFTPDQYRRFFWGGERKFNLPGFYLEENKMIATDGHRLLIEKVKFPKSQDPVLFPTLTPFYHAFKFLYESGGDFEVKRFRERPKKDRSPREEIFFINDEMEICVRMDIFARNFPNYKHVIPDKMTPLFSLDKLTATNYLKESELFTKMKKLVLYGIDGKLHFTLFDSGHAIHEGNSRIEIDTDIPVADGFTFPVPFCKDFFNFMVAEKIPGDFCIHADTFEAMKGKIDDKGFEAASGAGGNNDPNQKYILMPLLADDGDMEKIKGLKKLTTITLKKNARKKPVRPKKATKKAAPALAVHSPADVAGAKIGALYSFLGAIYGKSQEYQLI
jgi:hypothetical protein